MALPVTKDITIYKGDSYELTFTLYQKELDGSQGDPVDLTGATVTSQIRTNEDSTVVLAEFTATHNDTGGEVVLKLTPAQTALLPAYGGMWDAQVEWDADNVTTYLRGKVTVIKEITRVST